MSSKNFIFKRIPTYFLRICAALKTKKLFFDCHLRVVQNSWRKNWAKLLYSKFFLLFYLFLHFQNDFLQQFGYGGLGSWIAKSSTVKSFQSFLVRQKKQSGGWGEVRQHFFVRSSTEKIVGGL